MMMASMMEFMLNLGVFLHLDQFECDVKQEGRSLL